MDQWTDSHILINRTQSMTSSGSIAQSWWVKLLVPADEDITFKKINNSGVIVNTLVTWYFDQVWRVWSKTGYIHGYLEKYTCSQEADQKMILKTKYRLFWIQTLHPFIQRWFKTPSAMKRSGESLKYINVQEHRWPSPLSVTWTPHLKTWWAGLHQTQLQKQTKTNAFPHKNIKNTNIK